MKVTDCASMFSGLSDLTEIDILSLELDTSKVLDFGEMFRTDSKLTEIDISNLDMRIATNMTKMFMNCKAVTNIKLGDLRGAKPTSISYLFAYCNALTNVEGLENLDTSNATSLEHLFNGCYDFEDFNKIENWDTSKVTNMSYLFYNIIASDQEFAPNWNVEKVTNIEYAFYYLMPKKFDLGNLNFAALANATFNFVPSTSNYIMEVVLPNLPKVASPGVFSHSKCVGMRFRFGEGKTWGNNSTSTGTLNITRIWQASADTVADSDTGETVGDFYEAFANSIGANTSGKTRTIRLYTTLYNSLTDEQKALLTDKGYTLSYGTS